MRWLAKRLVWLAVLALLLSGCQNVTGRSNEQEAATPTPIPTSIVPDQPTYVVQRGDLTKKIEFTGRISAVDEQTLFFKSTGYVKEVYVDRDTVVEAGDMLAELEMEDLLKQLAQAEVSLNSVQLRLEEAEKSQERQIAQAELEVAAAQARLTQAQNANADAIVQAQLALSIAEEQLARLQAREPEYSAEVLAADISLTQAETARADAETEYQEALDRDWEREEVRDGYRRALEQAENNLKLAQARHSTAVAAQDVYQHDLKIQELAVEQAKARLTELQRGVDPTLEINLKGAQQQLAWLQEGTDPVLVNEVNQAELALERLQNQVSEAQIVSPIDGIVLSIGVTAGRPVEAYAPVIVVADPSEKEMSADLAEVQLQELVEGMPVTVSRNTTSGQTWQGTIRRLPYPYGTGGGTDILDDTDESTRISIEGDPGDLDLGDMVRAVVVLEEKQDTLWLPPSAIRSFQERNFVIVQDASGQRRVDVQIGIESTERVEILSGLEEGQMVLGQ